MTKRLKKRDEKNYEQEGEIILIRKLEKLIFVMKINLVMIWKYTEVKAHSKNLSAYK